MADSTAMDSDMDYIEDGVSGRGEVLVDEDEDLYYIPERRPSLDLGPAPMDTSNWHFIDQALSPAQSYDRFSSEDPEERAETEESSTRVLLERADSYSSCYTVDSDDCEKLIPCENDSKPVKEPPKKLELIQDPEEIKHPSFTLKFTFKALCDALKEIYSSGFSTFKRELWTYYPQPFSGSQGMDIVDLVDRLLETFSCETAVQITRSILVSIYRGNVADRLLVMCHKNEVSYDLRAALIKKYSEEVITEGDTRPLDDIYTDLHVLSSPTNGPNMEHEIMKLEKLETEEEQGTKLSVAEFFSEKMMTEAHPRRFYLLGNTGTGKSTFIKKLILDWALGRSHQHLNFIFPIAFRELNQFENTETSLEKILQHFFPMLDSSKGILKFEENEALFIFDGLDEYVGEIEFDETGILSSSSRYTTLKVILTNLLRGRIIRSSKVLVATRPTSYKHTPWGGHYQETEICGFPEASKEEYFKKRFKDPDQAAAVIEYIKSVKTFHIMCHLPLFCALVADECQRVFRETGTAAKLPRNITYMYTKLLLTLLRTLRKTRAPDLSPEEEQAFLMDLGKFAYGLMEEEKFATILSRNLKINLNEAMNKTGLCTQFMIIPSPTIYENMLSFIHPTVQEYMVALYAYLSFRNLEENIFEPQGKFKKGSKGPKITKLYKAAVEKSMECDDGRMDMFLRFLFGMSCKTNQELLRPFLKPSATIQDVTKELVSLINKNTGSQHPERNRNLQRCKEELEI